MLKFKQKLKLLLENLTKDLMLIMHTFLQITMI